ncbi:MAG: ABC transporter permease [Propionibacteriaceae bacterium]|jgi:putative ABC transport system permease protein|nr:ABC transporter permease [Propionibacteriaceae bacterium]
MVRFAKMTLHDLWEFKTQFLAVAVMVALGTMVYVGVESVWLGMKDEGEAYFDETSLADLWVLGAGFSEQELSKVRGLPEVSAVDIVTTTTATAPTVDARKGGTPYLLVMSPSSTDISRAHVFDGVDYSPSLDGIWLHHGFAVEHGFAVGDEITLKVGEQERQLTVRGLVFCPDFVSYTGSPSQVLPNHSVYSYALVGADTIKELDPSATAQQLRITLSDRDSVDIDHFKTVVADTLAATYSTSSSRWEWSGTAGFLEKANQIQRVAIIFSLVFFALSLLCIRSTIKRIIAQQRRQIGVLKAVGHSGGVIMGRYLLSVGIVAAVAGIAGVALGLTFLTPFVLDVERALYDIPTWEGGASNTRYVLVGLSVLFCVGVAAVSAYSAVRELPAVTLRNSSVVSAKRTLVESWEALWSRLSFSARWAVRDMSRNRLRTVVGVIGAAGSLILLMASLGLDDSIRASGARLYGEQYSYGWRADFRVPVGTDTQESVSSDFNHEVQWLQEMQIEVRTADMRHTGTVVVFTPGFYFNVLDARGDSVSLETGDVAVSAKFADSMGLSVNDTIQVSARGKIVTAIITNVVPTIAPQGIYVSEATFEGLGWDFQPTVALVGDWDDVRSLEEDPAVLDVVRLSDQYHDAEQALLSVRQIVRILIAAAVIIAVTVMYSIGLLNYLEREREYATLKVLGFTRREIFGVVVKDALLVLALGALLGLPLGWVYLNVYVQSVATSSFDFLPVIRARSILLSLAAVVGSSGLAVAIVCWRIARLDMVESLKSVE